jgi:hypothetical protein
MHTFEKINWEKLGFANTSSWLRGLISQDYKTRMFGYGAIEDQIVRGGMHSQDTDRGYGLSNIMKTNIHLYVVPFILEFLGNPDVADKANLLYLLAEMARYVRYNDGTELDKMKATQIHHTIWAGLPTFIDLLSASDRQLKVATAFLLSEYPKQAEYLTLSCFMF